MPARHEPEPEVVEPEIVGLEPPPSPWWRRVLARAALAAFLSVLGAGLCLVGVILTITVVGAGIGIPLIVIGLCILVLAVIIFFGGGRAWTGGIDIR